VSDQYCKICSGVTSFVGTVDFDRSLNPRGTPVPPGPIETPIHYWRCDSCGFFFTDAFDEWTVDDFRERIYNDGYAALDPDYAERRPLMNAATIHAIFKSMMSRIRILDYGGGNGRCAELLESVGFKYVCSYDGLDGSTLDDQKHDLITCFETLEHLPDPHRAVREITDRLAPSGLVMFTTLAQPHPPPGVEWWYLGPRNGHISLFSHPSLSILFGQYGMRVRSINNANHVACRVGEEDSEMARLVGQAFG
jgi:SAM-dependent methyltransferase